MISVLQIFRAPKGLLVPVLVQKRLFFSVGNSGVMAGPGESYRAALESALRLREKMVSSKLSSLDNSGAQSPQ